MDAEHTKSPAAGAVKTFRRDVIRNLPLLSLLSDEMFSRVIREAKVTFFEKHATVIGKGGMHDWMGFVLDGRLQVVDTLSNGIEVGLYILKPGQFFGELSVIDRQPRAASLIAMIPCEVLILSGDLARRLFFNVPAIAEAMLSHFSQIVRRTNELRTLLSIPQAPQRLYALLVYLMQSSHGGLVVVEPMPTHHELSIMINTSRETVTRALGALQRLGVVEKDHARLIIREPQRLQNLAIPDRASV